MTVLPGSLDYLYYNGILDHIPYEAYQGVPNQSYSIQNTPVTGSEYINQVKQGLLYDTYNTPDSFKYQDGKDYKKGEKYSFSQKAFGLNDGIGRDSDFEINAVGNEGKNFRKSIVDGFKTTASAVNNTSNHTKGILSLGIIGGTLFCLIKGKKKQPAEDIIKPSFWSKINPFKFLKK